MKNVNLISKMFKTEGSRSNRRWKKSRSNPKSGFTLIEILVVVAIIGSLLALATPTIFSGIARAQSSLCAANLRNIGQAVNGAANDNNGTYPEIDNGAPYSDYPTGSTVPNLYTALSPYGVTMAILQCPLDKAQPTYFAQTGSSYEWSPALDDEAASSPVLYARGTTIPLQSNKVRLCMDYSGWHRGKVNRLYADGHVVQN